MATFTFHSYNHTGIVVKDAEATAKSYTDRLGAGPWKFNDSGGPLVLANGNIGDIEYELLQPKDGVDSLWAAFLAEHGEGLHHVAYNVDEVDACVAELKEQGGEIVVYNGKPIAHPKYMAYVYIGGPANIIVEFLSTEILKMKQQQQ